MFAACMQVHYRLDFILEANTMTQVLIWVKIVCNIGYLNTKAEEMTDDKSCSSALLLFTI